MNPTGEDLLVCAGADEISGCYMPAAEALENRRTPWRDWMAENALDR